MPGHTRPAVGHGHADLWATHTPETEMDTERSTASAQHIGDTHTHHESLLCFIAAVRPM